VSGPYKYKKDRIDGQAGASLVSLAVRVFARAQDDQESWINRGLVTHLHLRLPLRLDSQINTCRDRRSPTSLKCIAYRRTNEHLVAGQVKAIIIFSSHFMTRNHYEFHNLLCSRFSYTTVVL